MLAWIYTIALSISIHTSLYCQNHLAMSGSPLTHQPSRMQLKTSC